LEVFFIKELLASKVIFFLPAKLPEREGKPPIWRKPAGIGYEGKAGGSSEGGGEVGEEDGRGGVEDGQQGGGGNVLSNQGSPFLLLNLRGFGYEGEDGGSPEGGGKIGDDKRDLCFWEKEGEVEGKRGGERKEDHLSNYQGGREEG